MGEYVPKIASMEGVIAQLISMLDTSSPMANEAAAAVLRRLSRNDHLKTVVAREGAIGPLVTLLHSGSDGARAEAAAALTNLAFVAENMQKMVDTYAALPHLINLLERGSAQGR